MKDKGIKHIGVVQHAEVVQTHGRQYIRHRNGSLMRLAKGSEFGGLRQPQFFSRWDFAHGPKCWCTPCMERRKKKAAEAVPSPS